MSGGTSRERSLLAAFSTPLVLSVHSVVSFDFAMALTPGWHTTIFPPYFVAGAIFSGLGMVFTIIIPLRKWWGLQHYVTLNHLDAAAKLCLFTSLVVGSAYMTEWFVAWYSGNQVEKDFFANRLWGQWWWSSAILYTCNMVLPLSLFWQKLRRSPPGSILSSHHIALSSVRDVCRPSRMIRAGSGPASPTGWNYAILAGISGVSSMWFLRFIKQLPVLATPN